MLREVLTKHSYHKLSRGLVIKEMVMRRNLSIGLMLAAVLLALAIGSSWLERRATVEAAGVQAPRFEVDPMWPKPLPNHWVQGNTIGVSVDSKDHIWIIHRAGSLEAMEIYAATNRAECCKPAPAVLEFDEDGNLLNSWGGADGPGYQWPASNHGITVDYKGNVWIGGNGRTASAPATAETAGNAATGAAATQAKQAAKAKAAPGGPPHYHDSMVLKFTQQGKFLMAIGNPGASEGSNDVENLGLPAKIFVDPKTNELYIADGYGNKRVIVFDADTGKYKRHWGAYGHKPDDTNLGPYRPDAPPAQQFRNPVHCAELSLDGLLYVCDRVNDRIQVFKPDGTFVKEAFVAKNTLGDGSAWDIAFSKDPQQKYMYLVDGANEKIYIMLRETLEILTSFGDGGRQPGQFYAVHSIATDSKGNIFITETYRGQRVQKFVYKGLAAVTRKDQGVVWPKK
jgi:DNA-binding beta-propeller fold protein YncE